MHTMPNARTFSPGGLLLALLLAAPAASASMGVREAAVGLERQLARAADPQPAAQEFVLPLAGSSVVLQGNATLEPIDAQRCRRTVELVHNQPFERRGLLITNLSRRSVEEGACRDFTNAMVAQVETSARNIASQIGLTEAAPDAAPGARIQVSTPAAPAPVPAAKAGAPVLLTVLEKALIRDAPSTQGEKLSRADKGTTLSAQRIEGNPDWFVLDGGLRFISASVVDVSDAGSTRAPARGDLSRVLLKVNERAVLRNAPSFKGQRVASINAGVERTARKVPNKKGWFELLDSSNSSPLYIHESVVTEKPSDGRRKKRL